MEKLNIFLQLDGSSTCSIIPHLITKNNKERRVTIRITIRMIGMTATILTTTIKSATTTTTKAALTGTGTAKCSNNNNDQE